MSERVRREATIPASPEEVWQIVTGPGWLVDEVRLELVPGGEASFRSGEEERRGWIEEARACERLAFWWSSGEEPASRVQITLERLDGATRVRVVEARPLNVLDAIGIPLPGSGGATHGPALVAA